MEYRRELYKNSRFRPGDRVRTTCAEALSKARMESRMNLLQSRRNLEEEAPEDAMVTKEKKRIEMLAQWKAKKQKMLSEQKKKQKPIFRVGILQRKATGSPMLKMEKAYAEKNFLNPDQLNKFNKLSKENPERMMTRAKAKALNLQNQENIPKMGFAKIVNNKRKQIKNHAFTVPKAVSELSAALKLTIPQSPKVLKHDNKKNVKNQKPIAEESKKETCEKSKNEKTEVKVIDEIALKIIDENKAAVNEKNQVQTTPEPEFVPVHYSPFVNKFRGSDCRPLKPTKLSLSLDIDKLIEKENNEFHCRIYSFRKYIECQTKQLLDSCNYWRDFVKDIPDTPQDAADEILCLCGKSNLLTSDKFLQFKSLIDKCEAGDQMVKIEDLQGFQDWVSIDVDKLNEAFAKLGERKANNWKNIEPEPRFGPAKKEANPVKKKTVAKRQPTATSSIREHILAARKLKKEAVDISSFQLLDTWSKAKSESLVKTPKNKQVQNNEALNSENKKNSIRKSLGRRVSGVEIIVATQLAKCLTPGKTPIKHADNQVEIDNYEICTPLKSILKQTPLSLNASKRSVQFQLSSASTKRPGLHEKYFEPLEDDENELSSLSIRMDDADMNCVKSSGKSGKRNIVMSTPIRRSSRLANK